MAKSTQLTSRQVEIVAFIKQTIENEQRPPTFREIMKRFDFRSPNSVSNHLHALQRRGILTFDGGARAIKLIGYTCKLERRDAIGTDNKPNGHKPECVCVQCERFNQH